MVLEMFYLSVDFVSCLFLTIGSRILHVTERQFLCQQYTLSATRDTCWSIEDLETEIVKLEVVNTSRGERGCIEDLKSKKMAFANLLDGKVQGAPVQSRIQNITEMDDPSLFFWAGEEAWTE